MMMEINWLKDSRRCLIGSRAIKESTRIFLDPLFVLRSELAERDIVLCHDVGPLSHGDLYGAATVDNYRIAYEKIRRHRPALVFVSDWSKNNFISIHGSDFRFLTTIPLYVRTGLFEGSLDALPGLDGAFFLTVGAFETRKNQIAALEAYRDSGFYQQGIKYVLCGSRGDGHDRIIAFAKSVPGVVVPGYVPDSQLRWLYTHAEAFVLPSLLEGFGMPALEAAHMGLLLSSPKEVPWLKPWRVCACKYQPRTRPQSERPCGTPFREARPKKRRLARGCGRLPRMHRRNSSCADGESF